MTDQTSKGAFADPLEGLPPDLVEAIRKYGHLIPQSRTINLVMGAYEFPATTASAMTAEQWMHAWVKEWQRANRAESALEEVLDVAERIRGGDTSLDPEAWYAARDFARVVLKGEVRDAD